MMALSSAPLMLAAADLGVYGPTRDIPDVDMRLALAQTAQLDTAAGTSKLKDSAKAFGDNQFSVSLFPAEKNYGTYIDPSFAITGDITAPVKDAAGNWGWQTVWKKGQMFNPLEAQAPFWNTNMLFIDVNDEDQMAFAKQALATVQRASTTTSAKRLMIIATAGNPFKATEKLGEPVMALNVLIQNRFKLEHVPAMVGLGTDDHAVHFAVTYFAPRYKAKSILAAWNGWPVSTAKGAKK